MIAQLRVVYGDAGDVIGPFDINDKELYAFNSGFLCGRLAERHPDYDPTKVRLEIIVEE